MALRIPHRRFHVSPRNPAQAARTAPEKPKPSRNQETPKEHSLEPRIAHEDDNVLIVSKPSRMHTAPAEGAALELSSGPTLVDWVNSKYPAVASVKGRKQNEGGLLHRLDYDTSGLVMFAKSQTAFDSLLQQFHDDAVAKGYLALSNVATSGKEQGKPNDLTDAVWQSVLSGAPAFKLPLRVTIDSYFQTAGVGGNHVKVIPPTHKILKKYKTTKDTYRSEVTILQRNKGVVATQVKILRGYRHQIRSHLSYLGLPIINDPLYNSREVVGELMLHALALAFDHPFTKEKLYVRDEVPARMAGLLNANAQL